MRVCVRQGPFRQVPLVTPNPLRETLAGPTTDTISVQQNHHTMSLEKHISEVFAIPESSILDTLALSDIPTWDSLAHMLFVVRLEEVYKVQFTGDEIADIKTVGDTRSVLQAHGATL